MLYSVMAQRIIVRIELTPKARDRLDESRQRAGMTQLSMLSRLVEWFADQPQVVQSAIMGHLPIDVEGDVAKLVLKRLAESGALAERRHG
jgi:hypothetical protein